MLSRLRITSLPRIPEWVHAALFVTIGLLGYALLDDTWIRVLFLVTLYGTLGMGLNVVVGLAGLLDLGFVAFFAACAFEPGSPQMTGQVAHSTGSPLRRTDLPLLSISSCCK